MALDLRVQQQVPASAIIDAIASKRNREQQIKSQRINDVLNTVKTGSDIAQTMVQDSVARQHAIAVKTLGSLLARQNEPTIAPGAMVGPQPEGTLPTGLLGPEPSGSLNQPAPIPFGQTPQYNAQLNSSLFNAFPAEAAKQQLEQIYSEKKDKGNTWEPAKPMLIDGQPRLVSMNPGSGAIRDASTFEMLNGKKVEPYVPPSSYGAVREELGVQANLTDMVHSVKSELTTSPSAKVVIAADNFTNQVDRVLKGDVKPDKTTMAALMSELDRALSSGVSSERRMEELTPKTFQGKFADFETFMTNNPTSRDTQEFLKNLRVEAKAAGDQRRAAVENIIKPILASARLSQKKDPIGFKTTVESMGLDARAASVGKIKFLPNASSIFYGEGFGASGSPLPATSGGTDLGNGFSYTVRK